MNTGDERSTYVAHDRRIAIIGGSKFDNAALDRFLWNLKEKYPNATIITGNGRGAEQHAFDSATTLGFTVERPPLRPEWYGKEAMMVQVGAITGGDIELYKDDAGKTQHRFLTAPCDVRIFVGEGSRVTRGLEHLHRMNMHQRDARGALVKKKGGGWISLRTKGDEIVYHILPSAEATPKAKAKRPVKKAEQLAA